jgi:hypothetical protein
MSYLIIHKREKEEEEENPKQTRLDKLRTCQGTLKTLSTILLGRLIRQ